LELEEKTEELVAVEAVERIVDSIYALDVAGWADEHFAKLEAIIDRTINLIEGLPAVRRRALTVRLLIAREGVEDGLAPDPAKRPSVGEMRAFVSSHL
jgi:hypothetical protein